MISLSDNETERLLRLMSLLSSSKFPAFSASKYLQNSSIIPVGGIKKPPEN